MLYDLCPNEINDYLVNNLNIYMIYSLIENNDNKRRLLNIEKATQTNAISISFNPSRAKFFRENTNIYLHFMSFLHTNKAHAVEIPPRVRQGPAHST